MTKTVVEAQDVSGEADTGVLPNPGLHTRSEESAGASGQPETVKLTLLHVEDNPADAMLVQEYLRDLVPDIAFDTAARLSEVTPKRVRNADCALLDLSLPDASGLEALHALRMMDEDLPIIVLTGFDDMELGLTAVRLGADDYLLKNQVDAYTLERSVLYAIERRGLMFHVAKLNAEAHVATEPPMTAHTAAPQAPVHTGHHPPELRRSDLRSTVTPFTRESFDSGQSAQANELLTPAEVSALLYVDPKTVTRWAIDGKIGSVRTPGGHRRFFKYEILAMVHGTRHSGTGSSLPAAHPLAVGTAQETEADAVVRAVTATAEALVRAAVEAAAAARAAR